MTDIAGLGVELDLDSNRLTGNLSAASAGVKKFSREIAGTNAPLVRVERQIDSVAASVSKLDRLMTGFIGFQGVKMGVGSLLDAQKAMQQIHYGFVGALGTEVAAVEALEFVRQKSEELGLDLQTTATEYTKLTASATALNVPLKDQRELFDGLARSATVLHLSSDQMKYATMALSQMFGKGKIQAEELRRQLGEQIPGVVPRFQRAVMEMTKGTDLAGKSFDDLLMMGALSTDKYLPALIQALQETGRGAEQAAHSMNAELNRLKNAWFEMRAETSKGLFSDTVIAGAQLLTKHMQLIADTALVAGAAVAASFAGRKLGAGTEMLRTLKAEQIALRESARAHVEMATTRAQTRASKLAELETNRELLRQNIVNNNQLLQEANRHRLTAAAHQKAAKSAVDLSGSRYHLRKATQELAAAEALRNKHMAEAAVLGQQSARIDAQMTAARTGLARATVAQELAQKRLAAGAGIMGMLGRSVANLGRAFMGLVGGPIGLAIMGGMALFGTINRISTSLENAKEESKKFADSLELSRFTMDDVESRFRSGDVGLREYAEAWAIAGMEIRKAREELEAQQASQKRWQMLQNAMSSKQMGALASSGGFMGSMVRATGGLIFGKMASDYDQSASKLNEQIELSKQKLREMAATLEQSVDPEVMGELYRVIEDSNGSVESLNAAIAKLPPHIQKAILSAMELSGVLSEVRKEIDGLADSNFEAQFGKVAMFEEKLLRQVEALEKSQGAPATAEQLADFQRMADEYRYQIGLSEQLAAQKKNERAATSELSKAEKERAELMKSASDRIAQMLAQNNEALLIEEKMNPAQKLRVRIMEELRAAGIRLNETEKTRLDASLAELEVSAQKVDAMNKERAALADLARLKNELAAEEARVALENGAELAGLSMGRDAQDQARRQASIMRDYQSKLAELKSKDYANETKSYEVQLQELEAHLRKRLTAEAAFQAERKRLEGDWKTGFKSGWADIVDTVNNTAASMKSVTSSLFDGMSMALTNFVMTGKASFKDFTRSILADLAKIAMQKAIVGIAGSLFGGWMSAGTAAAGQALNATSGVMAAQSSANPFVLGGQFANGGIMTSQGSLPLNFYENGGIARRPQMAIFGEGRLPEAYVPLPDGRSIPVTMEGGVGGGVAQTNVEINVNIDNKGNGQTSSEQGQGNGKALGKVLEGAVREQIARETRPGGLIWKMRN